MHRPFRPALLAALAIVPALGQAQTPTAQALFDKHWATVGGRAAMSAAMPRTETGSAELSFAGITATYKQITAANGSVLELEIPGFGAILQGSDGTVAWSENPQAGATKLTGPDACEANAALKPTYWAPGTYKAATVTGETTFEGKAAWRVQFTSNCDVERTLVFDKATGLRIGEIRTSPQGETRSIFDDYKPFGAIRLPTKVTRGTPQGDIVITIEKVSFDPVPAEAVALPASVKALP
jgi:hypothetical protein